MNINFQTAKEHFKEKGYCEFFVNELDLDFYNFINTNLKCNENKNIQHLFTQFRFDSDAIETRYNSEIGYEHANLKKEQLFEEYGNSDISQCWFFKNDIQDASVKLGLLPNELQTKIEIGFNNIIRYLYDFDETQQIDHTGEIQLTYYNHKCKFTPHVDEYAVKLCSILVYLNENYDKNNGGLLLLNDEEVIPTFGKCAIMDLSNHNIKHGVSEVISGLGRYAILSFPILKK